MAELIDRTGVSGKTRKHSDRRQLLLDAAASQINAVGADNIDLAEIAEKIGFTRNALYYYVQDRDDIALLCFDQSSKALASDLEGAAMPDTSPEEQIREFVRINLDPERKPLAVLSERYFLTSDKRDRITNEIHDVILRLVEIFRTGSEAGQFRCIDPFIAANCLLGMLNWVQLAPRWLGEPSTDEYRLRLTDAVLQLLFNGFGGPAAEMPFSLPEYQNFSSKPYNAFDRQEATRAKQSQLVSTASQLFNRFGIDGTSINDIATGVGATKGAIYHYFQDKNEIVIACYERAFSIYRHFIEYADTHGVTGFQKAMLVHQLNCQAQASREAPLMLQSGLDALPDQIRAEFVAKSRSIWFDVQKFVSGGLSDESCRESDLKALTEVAVGTFAWLAKAEVQIDGYSPLQLANIIGDIVGTGILASK